jgi:apoptosis-inducing factor 1
MMSNSPKIIQVYPEKGNMGKVLPEYLSEWTTKKVREEGAEVIPEAFVTGVSMEKGQLAIKLNNGNIVSSYLFHLKCKILMIHRLFQLHADHAVIAVGLQPNTQLGTSSGLELHEEMGGFLVNAELEARSNLWVVSIFLSLVLLTSKFDHLKAEF